jgi:hypothetical protein
METLPSADRGSAATPIIVSSTDASHSAIGSSTAVDYNLASIHKNSSIIADEIVSIDEMVVILPAAGMSPVV